jgi:hypothetical protein
MTYHRTHLKPGQPNLYSILQPTDFRYWAKKLRITEDELHQAVSQVGCRVVSVRAWALRNKQSN